MGPSELQDRIAHWACEDSRKFAHIWNVEEHLRMRLRELDSQLAVCHHLECFPRLYQQFSELTDTVFALRNDRIALARKYGFDTDPLFLLFP